MKLTIEVTQTSFIYEYEVGENRHHSTSAISADLLCAFADLLKMCTHVTHADWKRRDREFMEQALTRELEEKRKKGSGE